MRYNVIYNVESLSTLSMENTLDGRDWLTKKEIEQKFLFISSLWHPFSRINHKK